MPPAAACAALVGVSLPAGRHERAWAEEDDGGRVLAPGVYVLRFTAGRRRAAATRGEDSMRRSPPMRDPCRRCSWSDCSPAGMPIAALGAGRARRSPPIPGRRPSPADTAKSRRSSEARALLPRGRLRPLDPGARAALAAATERIRSACAETYLLLIKTYVFLGNDLKFKPQGREASNLNYRRRGG